MRVAFLLDLFCGFEHCSCCLFHCSLVGSIRSPTRLVIMNTDVEVSLTEAHFSAWSDVNLIAELRCYCLFFNCVYRGRRGGLMVNALNSGSGGPGSSPGRSTALCSWARHFTLIVPLSTQVY